MLVADYLGFCTSFVGVVDSFLQFGSDSFFGCVAMQRVVYRHPVYRVVAVLAQNLIAKHLGAQVTHLHKQYAFVKFVG